MKILKKLITGHFKVYDKKDLSLVILAGGKGTRLKNIIGNKQKCIANINNKPFLDYI